MSLKFLPYIELRPCMSASKMIFIIWLPLESSGTPDSLLEKIHSIEQKFGRDRSLEVRNGPRSLDIEELFGNQTVKKENLVIPHERLLERAFVLAPFLEVLQKNADVNKADIEFYGKKLELLKDQRVEKYCSF